MLQKHESFDWPTNHNLKIWRYTSLAKFAALLQTKALHFARLDTLDDPFEGSSTLASVALREYIREHRHKDPRLAGWAGMSDGEFDHVHEQLSIVRQKARSLLYVNCWHMSEYESFGMWKLYGAVEGAVCIQSTFSKLCEALPQDYFVGMIKYVDYSSELIPEGNIFNFVMHKRRQFEHERELRAVWLSAPVNTPAGKLVQVEVPELIENVFVSPASPDWFTTVVTRLMTDAGFAFPVLQSKLSNKPVY